MGWTGRSSAKRKAQKGKRAMLKMRKSYNKLAKRYGSTVKSFRKSSSSYRSNMTRLQRESQNALSSLGASHISEIRASANRRRLEMAAQRGKGVQESKAIGRKYAKETIGTRNVSGSSSKSAKGSVSSPRVKSKRRRPTTSSRSRRPR